MTSPLRKMIGLIDAVNRAEFKGETVFKEPNYTDEQRAMLAFYEPAARIFCKNNGKNPDSMCDVLKEGTQLSGLPDLHRVPAWHTVVDMIHEVYRAIGQATVESAMAATSVPESPAEPGEPEAVH